MSDYKLRRIIRKKRNGEELEGEEIQHFVDAVTKSDDAKGAVDRCQIGAMLMAMYLNGLSPAETSHLTFNMRDSGRVFEWSEELQPRIVDKHSTGGVGDKISLVLVPALATCHLLVPMISGRSLGHTGGTLDKLEAIDQCSVNLTDDEIRRAIETIGCCIVGQTDQCVPADRVLYECRDMTSTVDYPPLVIASIVSKKLSENPSALVYDVKFGKGSFFKTMDDALDTAKGLVKASYPVKSVAFLTSMDVPIGRAVGDSLEVLEAVACLKGKGPHDVMELVEALGDELLRMTGISESITVPLRNGKALEKFADMLMLQHAGANAVRDLCYGEGTNAFRRSQDVKISHITYSGGNGYITSIDPLVVGSVWKEEYSCSQNNPHVGFMLMKTVGDAIQSGDVWLHFHHQGEGLSTQVREELSAALQVSPFRKERKLIEKRVFMRDGDVLVEDYDP